MLTENRLSILNLAGMISTDLSVDVAWVDPKGHDRVFKLAKDGDYNSICNKRHEQVEKANKDHASWRKQFMRWARAH